MFFGRGGVPPPRLGHDQTFHSASIASFLVSYQSYVQKVQYKTGDGFKHCMTALSVVMGSVYQDTFTMRDCDNVADTTGVKIRKGLEKVAHINRVIEKLNLTKFGTTCGGSLKKILTHLDLLSIPQSGGKMSKRLDGIIGCKDKISSWHLNGFPYSSNIGSTV